MIERDRGTGFKVVTAIVLFVLVSLVCGLTYEMAVSHTERKLRAEDNSRSYTETTEERIQRLCASVSGRDLISCIKDEVESSEDHRRSEYDLSAQQDMSNSAFWTVWVSIAGVAVTSLGLYLVWGTLEQTRVAAVAAIKGVEAANATLVAQFRPRIRVGMITIGQKNGPAFAEGKLISGSVGIVNIGSYPADIRESHCEIYIGKNLPMHRPYQGVTSVHIFKRTLLKPGFSLGGGFKSAFPLTVSDISKINGKDANLYIMGYVRYADPDGILRRTMFCSIYCTTDGRLKRTNDPDYEVEN